MIVTFALVVALSGGCGRHADKTAAAAPAASWMAAPSASAPAVPSTATTASPTPAPSASRKPTLLPRPGNPAGHATIPSDAQAADTSHPDHKIGNGSPAGCTSAAVVKAVAQGGVITFDCGPDPITITMTATAKVRTASTSVVLDGGGRVTLSGGGKRRILYLNTCDPAQGFTTSHCVDQATPRLTVQNMAFADGNSIGQKTTTASAGAAAQSSTAAAGSR